MSLKKRDKIFVWTISGVMLFSALAISVLVIIDVVTNKEDSVIQQIDEQIYTGGDFDSLRTEDLREGTGQELQLGDEILVNYSLTLKDGTPVEGNNTFESGAPISFVLEIGGLIDGWTNGLPGMRVGGLRRLEVPSTLGYGEFGRPPAIPGSAGLIFEVELLEILEQ